MIGEVLSRVETPREVFRDVVREWEEECAEYFGVPIRRIMTSARPEGKKSSAQKLKPFLFSVAKKILLAVPPLKNALWDKRRPELSQDIGSPLSLCFIMNNEEVPAYLNSNCLPVFLDVWSDWALMELVRRTKKLRLFYVTYLELYRRIKERFPESGVRYIPQSVSSRYYSENFAAYRNKTIDVIQIGRINPVLHEYMMKYVSEHGGVEYVFRENGVCVSASGARSWPVDTRDKYMSLLAASKVALVGCSGVDGMREGTNGICAVTPRFYEAAVSGCALISRYPDNEEFRQLEAAKYFPNVTSYENFTECLERALSQTPEELYAQNHDFIINSFTSKRAEQIQKDIAALL